MENNKAVIKKHNALTDGFIPRKGKEILPDKLINALYSKYEQEGTEFEVTKTDLRRLLGLKSSKDDDRIWDALQVLATPIQIRDFTFEGKKIKRTAVAFLNEPTEYEGTNTIELRISEKMIEALKQKVGYTPIELELSNSFRTKYALKLYELYKRYYSLPNNKGADIGTIAKSMDELNKMFGTKFKHASKMLEGINRGLKEIEKKAGVFINCHYDKNIKAFVFGWQQEVKHPNLRIPFSRIDEFIEYYIAGKKPKMKDPEKYRKHLRKLIIADEFSELDSYWAGMLFYKYGVPKEDITKKEYFNKKTRKWKNFTRKTQPKLTEEEEEIDIGGPED